VAIHREGTAAAAAAAEGGGGGGGGAAEQQQEPRSGIVSNHHRIVSIPQIVSPAQRGGRECRQSAIDGVGVGAEVQYRQESSGAKALLRRLEVVEL
jgi:hypothetical protein